MISYLIILNMTNRRSFLQRLSVATASSIVAPVVLQASPLSKENVFGDNTLQFPIGFAGYSFVKFNLDQSLDMMKQLQVKYLSVKDFHLPLNSSSAQMGIIKKKITDHGIVPYTVGVIYMKSKKEVDRAFDYAQAFGVSMIVGVPDEILLPYVEEKVKLTNIKMAIHNHGPEDKLYPTPKSIYDRIKNMDARMGLCIDIGHTFRAGILPEESVMQCADRLFDLHIKDEEAMKPDAKTLEIGRGAINFSALIDVLRRINYKGMCSIEYEKDMDAPLVGMAESVGFFKGMMRK
jgi:sugar phosphate isomerase/epimerase